MSEYVCDISFLALDALDTTEIMCVCFRRVLKAKELWVNNGLGEEVSLASNLKSENAFNLRENTYNYRQTSEVIKAVSFDFFCCFFLFQFLPG